MTTAGPFSASGRRPLEGLLVVGLEQAVAAPMATRHLADMGARVIKIENPRGGDMTRHYDDAQAGLAAHFVWCNRGKESVTLNIADPRGAAALERLLARADVLIQNLAPGAAARRGLDATQAVARHPRLVAVDISGYGEGGPLSHKRAYDMLVQSEGGSCVVTGGPGQPAKPGIAMIDLATGMYALSWILGALHGRAATGRGEALTIGMFDVVAEWMGYQVNYTMGTGVEQEPAWVGSPAVAPYGTYRTSDDQTVVLGTTNDGEWQRLARTVLERPDLADDPALASNSGRVADRARVDAAISAWTGGVTLKEAQETLDAAALGNARLNGVQDLIDHPQLAARDRWRPVATPHGEFRAVLPPPIAASWTPSMGQVPGLGEHTDAVLAEFGYSPAELAGWHRDGVI
ncbi:CoA transferase [Frankia sp. AgB1.9]|uniref:CaiB/BaiF CoA transferase family protein n=1 Tax=unclassified Frankia TaxID=2632575 RepID=UPI00193150A9|nr:MULTISPECIES: CaiB/BaiF CoA-transferase family protein [unclassified Frankia]MBL7493258.1 CoA transferase [Frankia sp. AgW1.1]MBL7547255.1 CoA transferase [Frankia sp. AgB1.9]MBL7618139.1 CoA transferase [Frankia sp. AgB1.8]